MDSGHVPDRRLLLHQRLLDRDNSGAEEAVALYYQPLVARLSARPKFRRADPHLIQEAAAKAVLDYTSKPAAFAPADLSGPELADRLQGHLAHAAECDLLNALRKETRQHRRDAKGAALHDYKGGEPVELHTPAGNAIEEEEARERDEQRRQILDLLTDPIDRRVQELRFDGVKKTAAFAEVLNITHLPPAEQRREVKRVKDRIDKILQRAFGPSAKPPQKRRGGNEL